MFEGMPINEEKKFRVPTAALEKLVAEDYRDWEKFALENMKTDA